MYHGAQSTWNKSSIKWWFQHKICSWRSWMLIVGRRMYISMKLKITLTKIGRKDTFIFTSRHKYSPEIIWRCPLFRGFTITCIARSMPLTCFHLLELHSPFQIILWVLILSKELDSGILLKRRLERISIPLRRPSGRLKEKPLLYRFMHPLISSILKLEMDTAPILKQDSGRRKDMQEDLVMLLTHVQGFSGSHLTGDHFGCQFSFLKYFSCPDSFHGFSCH